MNPKSNIAKRIQMDGLYGSVEEVDYAKHHLRVHPNALPLSAPLEEVAFSVDTAFNAGAAHESALLNAFRIHFDNSNAAIWITIDELANFARPELPKIVLGDPHGKQFARMPQALKSIVEILTRTTDGSAVTSSNP